MLLLLIFFFIPFIFAQQCDPNAELGPCDPSINTCPPLSLCIPSNVCCPFANISMATTTISAPTSAGMLTATTTHGCQDQINPSTGTSDCPNIKYLCTNPQYIPLMKQQCPKTCGFC